MKVMRPCKTFDQGLSLLARQNAEMNTHDPDAVQAALQVSPLLIFKYLKVYMQLCNDAIMINNSFGKVTPSARSDFIRIQIVLVVLVLRQPVPKSKLFKLSLAPVAELQFLQASQAWVQPWML